MNNFISENSFEFKLKKNNVVSNLNPFLNALPIFKRWILFTLIYPNEIVQRTIVKLENPQKEFKYFENNEVRFLLWLKSGIIDGSIEKVKVEICKQKFY